MPSIPQPLFNSPEFVPGQSLRRLLEDFGCLVRADLYLRFRGEVNNLSAYSYEDS